MHNIIYAIYFINCFLFLVIEFGMLVYYYTDNIQMIVHKLSVCLCVSFIFSRGQYLPHLFMSRVPFTSLLFQLHIFTSAKAY